METESITAKTPGALARALGLSAADAEERQVQYSLLERLRQALRAENLTHAELARRAGSSLTRVTAILNGNLTNVSTDLLIRLVGALGYRVKISVSRVAS
ncbi:MAG: XRE family transcriptional regulator [Bryobacteraceae bacterium]